MKSLKLILILSLIFSSSVVYGQRYFNNNTGNNLWMDAGNWSNGNIGNGSGHKVVIKKGNPIIDGTNVQVAQIKIGTAATLEAVTTITALNGGTLKLTGVNVTAVVINANTQAQGGKDIKFDLPLTINSSQATEAFQILAANNAAQGEAKIIFGSNGSLTVSSATDIKTANVTGNKRIEFNNALTSNKKLIINASGQVIFGPSFDGTNHSGIIEVLGNNAKITSNTSDDGTFVASGNKISTEANSEGVEVTVNGANTFKGDIETKTKAITYNFNKNQSSVGGVTLGAGNLNLSIDASVTNLAFANSSSNTWTGKIVTTGFKDGVISFGTDANGLTSGQLANIDIGGTAVVIDASGKINAEAPPEVSVSSFTNGGGDNLWSNVANWDNGIPNVPTAKVTLKANLILDSDVTLGQIKLAGGFGNVSVTSSNNNTLTLTGQGVTQPIQNNGKDVDLNFQVDVVLNSTDAIETFQLSGGGVCSVTFSEDLTLNIPTKFVAQQNRVFNMNGKLKGSGQFQVGAASDVIFGSSSDNSDFTGGFKMLGNNGKLIANTSDDSCFLPLGSTIEPDATSTGHVITINGKNIFKGNIKTTANALTLKLTKDQSSAGLITLGAGNLNLNVSGLTSVAFADNSSSVWGAGKLVVVGFKDDVISFGSDANGLTSDQLAKIDIGGTDVEISATGKISGKEVSSSTFNNSSGDQLWSNKNNWSNGIPNVNTAKVTLLDTIRIDEDIEIAQIKLGNNAPNAAIISTSNTLKINGTGVTQPIQNNAKDAQLTFDIDVVLESSDAVETIMATAGGACVITFNSDLTLKDSTSIKFVAQASRSININSKLKGEASFQVGAASTINFGVGSDNSDFTGSLRMLGNNGRLTANTADDGNFLASGSTIEPDATSTGHVITINGKNIFKGNIKTTASTLVLNVLKDQSSVGTITMGQGNLNLIIDTASVSKIAFADNSSANWGTGLLVMSNFKDNVVSFGTNANGITESQLQQIYLFGGAEVSITSDGSLILIKDTDGDGVTDDIDQCPNTPSGALVGADGCQIPLFIESITLIDNIFPNPVKTELRVSVKDNIKVREIYFNDLSGKIIKPNSINQKNRDYHINVSNIENGLYILNVIGTDNKFNRVKVIIKR